jgi:8-oxo-dGTP diphosphatase
MPNTAVKKQIHVVVGVIRNTNGAILIALRHPDAHQGGLWEFPGGKVEPNETVPVALARELEEELGIAVLQSDCQPLIKIHHDYGDKQVLLDVWWVTDFDSEPSGREGQPLRWVAVSELVDYAFPAANAPIVKAIQQAKF